MKPNYGIYIEWGIIGGAGLGVLYTTIIIIAAFGSSLENKSGDAVEGSDALLLLCCFAPLMLAAIIGGTAGMVLSYFNVVLLMLLNWLVQDMTRLHYAAIFLGTLISSFVFFKLVLKLFGDDTGITSELQTYELFWVILPSIIASLASVLAWQRVNRSGSQ